MSKYKVLEEGVLLDDWMDDNPEQPYIPKKTPSCNCNTCPDEDGHLLKDNFLGEFLTEADKRRARENLGLKDMEGDAANITYKTDTDPDIESVKDALDKLFYVPITISSFTVSPNEAETGSEVNTLTYNWKYNKEIKQQYFDGEEINASLRTKTITGATNASPIVITAASHRYITGDKVVISDVNGNTNANGAWVITKLTDDTFSLNNSSGNAAYTSGGTARKANFKWSDNNDGRVPTAYSTVSGVRNILVFKTHDSGSTWEAEYTNYGGVEKGFVRPNLSANGVLGGSSFAVSGTQYFQNYDYYLAFDGSSSTGTFFSTSAHDIIFYNPTPIKVTALVFTFLSEIMTTAGIIYGSNDGSTWAFIKSYTNSSTTLSVDMSSNTNYYKYYKNSVTASNSDGYSYGIIYEIEITATYIAV